MFISMLRVLPVFDVVSVSEAQLFNFGYVCLILT
jgi:hypothetical protein